MKRLHISGDEVRCSDNSDEVLLVVVDSGVGLQEEEFTERYGEKREEAKRTTSSMVAARPPGHSRGGAEA